MMVNIEEFGRKAVEQIDELYKYALSLTKKNEDEAKDLLQKTLEKSLRSIEKRGTVEITSYRNWFKKVMKNLMIDKKREIKRQPDHIDFLEVENFYENVKPHCTHDSHLEKEIFDNLLEDTVFTAIQELDVRLRTVLLLSDVEGLPHQEIADFVGSPVGTVRYQLHKARKMLRAKLNDYAIFKGYRIAS